MDGDFPSFPRLIQTPLLHVLNGIRVIVFAWLDDPLEVSKAPCPTVTVSPRRGSGKGS